MEIDKLAELNSKANDILTDIDELRSELGIINDPEIISCMDDLEILVKKWVTSVNFEYVLKSFRGD